MKIVLALWLLGVSSLSFAQKDNPEALPTKNYKLRIKTVAPASLRLPFQSIKIIDSRFDTSKIGFLYIRNFFANGYRPFRKVTLNSGVKLGIENFYNEYYKANFTNNDRSLLIVIKKLWISDVNTSVREQTPLVDYKNGRQYVYAKFEYYAGVENKYTPLKRIDTTFLLEKTTIGEAYDPKGESNLPFFCFSLESMIEKINYGNYFNNLANKKTFSLEEIRARNENEKNIPILNESIKKGIFLTFEEFKMNSPSVTDFRKNKLAKKKIYELLDNKNNVILHYFAYFDGQNLLMPIPLASLFSFNAAQENPVIYRAGNSFEFFELIGNRNAGMNDVLASGEFGPDKGIQFVPRQIDMETGLLY